MGDMLAFLLTLAAIASALVMLVRVASGSQLFRYDTNPYRRWCKKCGQQQEEYSRGGSSWWEDVGPEHNLACKCHGWQEYRR